MADNTMCGKAFSKLDSLRRHVNELHKGVRPFACNMCDKNYGRRDYLDRHLRTHDPENQKKKSVTGNFRMPDHTITKSLIFVQKFNFDKTLLLDNFSREIKVVNG